MRLILFITALSAAGCHQADGEFRIQPIAPLVQDAVQWETVTLQFELPGGTGNPFDPADFDVHLNMTGPNGQQWQHPAFFTMDHQIVVSHGREAVRNMKKSHWEVRWTPSEAGNYVWSLSAANASQRASMSGQVTCRQGQHSGFVRVAKRDPNWFETSDGMFFYPVGHVTRSPEDVRWNALSGHHPQASANSGTRIHADERSQPGALKTAKYETWFRRMRDNGENICTVWMSPWSLGLEWSPTHPGYAGIGYYNQIHAAQLDRIFELAERYGIRILLFTMNHGRLSTVIDREWYQHPYRRVDGQGFVDSPADYFSSAECLRLEQNRLRYILARWGHSTSLFGLGLCTEVNWVDPYHGLEAPVDAELMDGVAKPMQAIPQQRELVVERFRDLARFVKSTDVHQHPVSIQFALLDTGTEAWSLPEFEIVLNNAYANALQGQIVQKHLGHSISGVADGMLGFARYFDSVAADSRPLSDAVFTSAAKPKLVAEWGGHHLHNSHIRLAAELHTGIWAMSMTNLSGVTGFWWAEEIHHADLYQHFAPVAKFWAGIDRRGAGLVSETADVQLSLSGSDDGGLSWVSLLSRGAIVLSNSTRAYAYVYPRFMSSGDVFAKTDDSPLFPIQKNAWLTLPDRLAAGDYRIEFWNTYSGERFAEELLRVPANQESWHRLKLPPFRVDLAVRIEPL